MFNNAWKFVALFVSYLFFIYFTKLIDCYNIATQYFVIYRYFVVLFCASVVRYCTMLFLDVAVTRLKENSSVRC
jgi:hypothetical protein